MSGIPHFNFPRFWELARLLERNGHEVINPAEKESKHGTVYPDMDRIPKAWGGNSDLVRTGDIFTQDFNDVMRADGIALMPGWEKSSGAKMEAEVARLCGKRRFVMKLSNYDHNVELQEIPDDLVGDMRLVSRNNRTDTEQPYANRNQVQVSQARRGSRS
jgi:hypothetical protein